MLETEDLLPTEITKWLVEQLRLFRLAGGHGFLRINIQDGHIVTYGQYACKKHIKPAKVKPS